MTKVLSKIRTVVFLLVSVLFTCSVLPACSTKITYNEDMTQLFISNYGGGYGRKWLDDIAEEFEELYKDYKIGDKTGVEIVIAPNEMRGAALVQNAQGSTQDIFFTEGIVYKDLVSSGVALDISDMLKKENTDGKTIWSKFSEQQKDYYDVNGKVYCVPHYFSSYGMTYNVDIFENKSLYYAKGGCPSEFCTYTQAHNDEPATGSFTGYKYSNNKGSNAGNLSAGRDGKYGTFDDGLPATMEELFDLWDYMLVREITPAVYTGLYNASYVNPVAEAVICAIDGPETIKAYLNNNGTITDYVTGYSNDKVTGYMEKPITVNNGYEKYYTMGRYYAFKFMEKFFSNAEYCATNRPGGQSLSHTGAQLEYLSSNQTFYKNGKPIAMLMEGDYWENEARDYGSFTKIASQGGQTQEQMRNAFYPMPFADESQIGNDYAVVDLYNASGFINSAIPESKKELAEAFMMYCNTDKNLAQFQKTTNTMKALNYTLSEEDRNSLTYFGRSLYDYVASAKEKIYQISKSEVFLAQSMTIRESFKTAVYTDYLGCMHFKDDVKSGDTFFEDSYNYYKNRWDDIKGVLAS